MAVKIWSSALLSLIVATLLLLLPAAALAQGGAAAKSETQIVLHLKLLGVDQAELNKAGIKWENSEKRNPQSEAASTAFVERSELSAVIAKITAAGGKVLAEPTLMTTPGRTASFNSGGEIPVPTVSVRDDDDSSPGIAFRQFGTSLSVTPAIVATDSVYLDLTLESSALVGRDSRVKEPRVIISARKLSASLKVNTDQVMLLAVPDPQANAGRKSRPMLLLCLAPQIVSTAEIEAREKEAQADDLRQEVRELRQEVARLTKLVEPGAKPIAIDASVPTSRTGRFMFGIGINSDAGATGKVTQADAREPVVRLAPSREKLITKVYAVADLVVSAPNIVAPGRIASDPAKGELPADEASAKVAATPPAVKADFSKLINLLTETVEPGSWKQQGGPGVVQSFETNLSLVISQTETAHEGIAAVLQSLRRELDRMVQLNVEFLTITPEAVGRLELDLAQGRRTFSDENAAQLRAALKADDGVRILTAPKITMLNQQTCEVQTSLSPSRELRLIACAEIHGDADCAQLKFAVNARDAADAVQSGMSAHLHSGEMLVVDVTERMPAGNEQGVPFLSKLPYTARLFKKVGPAKGERTLLLISPRILNSPESQ